jgi:hypothetical protein
VRRSVDVITNLSSVPNSSCGIEESKVIGILRGSIVHETLTTLLNGRGATCVPSSSPISVF